MTNSFYKISLDVQDHGSHVYLKTKKNVTGIVLYINLTDGGRPYDITEECYAVFTARKADGKPLFNNCTIIDNTICYAFTPQTTASVGQAECEIRLYGADDKMIISAEFTLIVADTVYNEGDEVESAMEVTALTKLISDATTLIHDVEGRLASGAFIGLKGDKGDQGISGVVVYPKGYFALEMDSATGDLYCVWDDEANPPALTMDDSGNLYYEIKEA